MTNDKQRERRAEIKDMVINSPEISLTPVFDGDISEFEWEDKLVSFIEALLDKTRKEALKGKVFSTIEVNEKIHIPEELLDRIKQEARKEVAEDIVKDIFHKRSCRSHEPENCKICTERQRIIDMIKDEYLKD